MALFLSCQISSVEFSRTNSKKRRRRKLKNCWTQAGILDLSRHSIKEFRIQEKKRKKLFARTTCDVSLKLRPDELHSSIVVKIIISYDFLRYPPLSLSLVVIPRQSSEHHHLFECRWKCANVSEELLVRDKEEAEKKVFQPSFQLKKREKKLSSPHQQAPQRPTETSENTKKISKCCLLRRKISAHFGCLL